MTGNCWRFGVFLIVFVTLLPLSRARAALPDEAAYASYEPSAVSVKTGVQVGAGGLNTAALMLVQPSLRLTADNACLVVSPLLWRSGGQSADWHKVETYLGWVDKLSVQQGNVELQAGDVPAGQMGAG